MVMGVLSKYILTTVSYYKNKMIEVTYLNFKYN